MPTLSNPAVELKLLSLFMVAPYHIKLLSVDDNIFFKPAHKELAKLMKAYVKEYRAKPTKESLVLFANEAVENKEDLDSLSDALMILDNLPDVDFNEFGFYFRKAEDYLIGRSIYDLADTIKTKFEESPEPNYRKFRQELLRGLLSSGPQAGNVKRGYVYDTVKERWEHYKTLAKGGKIDGLIPFGIKSLDEKLGGMRKTYLVLMYSKTGGGKTRTSINIAYNVAQMGYNVMYFTLEMAFDLIATCFDSRMAFIDSSEIIYGRLDKAGVRKFKSVLKDQTYKKLNIWLVDNPANTTPTFINEEIELYKIHTGKEPDLIVIDYANLMKPSVPFSGRSEKYDFLFHELHETARFYDSALLTATMESRERSKADKKKKNEEEDEEMGVEGIGLSNYMAPHCEIVARLKQDKYDALQNVLRFIVEKHRYGKAMETIKLRALWDRNYVGDDIIPGTEGLGTKKYRVRKENDDDS